MIGGRSRIALAVSVVALLAGIPSASAAGGATWGSNTSRASVSSTGRQADSESSRDTLAVSAHGRYVAFGSYASNLAPGGVADGVGHVFVRDRLAGVTSRVDVALGGQQPDAGSVSESLSSDGRYIAFTSAASNLVKADTNGVPDVFVRDMQRGSTIRVSVGPAGRESNGYSYLPAMSADGRFVAFTSLASNLVSGDTNEMYDVFVRDLVGRATVRVSVGVGGQQGDATSSNTNAALSADGRFVWFGSGASNLVLGDTNGVSDFFVRDLLYRTTRRISVGTGNRQANVPANSGAMSADGRLFAFSSAASNLVAGDRNGVSDLFLRDLRADVTRRVSVFPKGGPPAGRGVGAVSLSADGRFVAFDSDATNIIVADTNASTDVFVIDLLTGSTRRASIAGSGIQANDASGSPTISADGRHVAFLSFASNLVPRDTNDRIDVFVRDKVGDVG